VRYHALHPVLSVHRQSVLEYTLARDQAIQDRKRADATRGFQEHWVGYTAVCVRRANRRRRAETQASAATARVCKAMAVKRDAAKKRQREARMAASAAVRAAVREADAVSARAQSAFGKRVRDVCALADRACAAAAAEEERAVKRQLVLWQSDRWAREWAVAFAARRAGIL
jgi:hypothetical protein